MSKRKKHSLASRHARSARASLKDIAIIFVGTNEGGELSHVINYKTGNRIKISETVGRAITDVQHKWSVHLAVFGTDYSGSAYMKAREAHAESPYHHDTLKDKICEEHKALIESFNCNDFDKTGWIASPCHRDFDDDYVAGLYEKFGWV